MFLFTARSCRILYFHHAVEDDTMTQARTTSQDALDALLCDSMPPQGHYWSAEQYLWLTDRTRRLIEPRLLNLLALGGG